MTDEALRRKLVNVDQSIGLAIDDFDAGQWEDAAGLLEELIHDATAALHEMSDRAPEIAE